MWLAIIYHIRHAFLFTSLATLAEHGQAVDDGGRVEAEDELVVGTVSVAAVLVEVGEGEVAEELLLQERVRLEAELLTIVDLVDQSTSNSWLSWKFC